MFHRALDVRHGDGFASGYRIKGHYPDLAYDLLVASGF
jgi:hypothetical protein